MTIIKKSIHKSTVCKPTCKPIVKSVAKPKTPPVIKITCVDDDDDNEEEEEDDDVYVSEYTKTSVVTPSNQPIFHVSAVTQTVRRHQSRRCSSNERENYSIEELRVDDETDDEDEPRKPIPKWAHGDIILESSRRQALECLNYTRLFRSSADTRIQLEYVFPVVKSTFYKRSSSAEWIYLN